MDKSELLRLAERVEALRGPDYTVNKSILAALGYTWRGIAYWSKDNTHFWKGSTAFTGSLDAAMTLVPEGCGWSLVQATYEKSYGCIESGDDRTPDLEARAATPALVLCAAALRSLAKDK